MKYILGAIAFVFCCSLSMNRLYAQKYKRVALGIHAGTAIPLGDGEVDDLAPAFGGNLKISFNNRFALRLEGQSWQIISRNYAFTAGNIATDFNAQLMFNAISFKKRKSAPPEIFSTIYFGLGGGYIMGELEYAGNIKKDSGQYVNPPKTMETTYLATTIGYKIKLGKVVDLYFEYTLKHTYSDLVNGFNPIASNNKANDYVSMGLVGLQFNIGRGIRNIEWTSGSEETYNKIVKAYKNVKDNPLIAEMDRRLDSLSEAFRREIDPLKTDTDGDGLADYYDREVNSPDPKGVDRYGITMDADLDGVPDYRDACPHEAGTLSNGCKVRPQKKNDNVIVVLRLVVKSLQFEPNKAVIRASSFASLNKLVKLMNDYPTYKLKIEGHTDNKGNPESNLKLSQARADAVKAYMVKRKVDPMRITAIGWGDTKPIVSNATPLGRTKNRRVELTLE